MLIVEIKGEETDETQAKHRFLAEWVDAINHTESFGNWRWTVITDPSKIDSHLQDLERELEQLKNVVASSGV